jgi:hypothetical protein
MSPRRIYSSAKALDFLVKRKLLSIKKEGLRYMLVELGVWQSNSHLVEIGVDEESTVRGAGGEPTTVLVI